MKKKFACVAMAMTSIGALAQTHYPESPKGDVVDEYFGTKVADPYRWLEDDNSQETAKWVEAQNKVTDAYLAKIPLRGKLAKRMKEVANYEKISAPSKHNGKYYFWKNDGLQNQSVMYVCDKLGGEAKVFLDPNKLSSDGTVALTSLSFSHDGKYLAYSISRSGSDWTEFYVMDVNSGQLLDDHIEWAKFSNASWCGDGFFYSAYDAPTQGREFSNINQGHKVYYHKIGTPQSADKVFYQNPMHPKRFYSVSVNKEETVMYLYESGEGNGNLLYVRDMRIPNSQFVQMVENADDNYSPIAEFGDKLYIYTTSNAPKGKIMVADINSPGINNWKELIAEGEHVMDGAEVIGDKLFITYSKDASTHAYVYSLEGKCLNEIKLPSVGTAYFSGKKGEKDCFYTFTSYTMPSTVYRYDMDSNTSTLYQAPKVAFKLNDYVSEQVFCTSKDGTRIPLFITYKKGMKRNGKNPLLLYGYGGFNISMNPSFSTMRIPFLEQGGIYVVACLRGGNEYGEQWHIAGTKMNKQNVFDDFIASAEYLIKEKYTNSDKLAIMGGSNGGLLVGACMTQRPELFKVAVPMVGVMDMLRYHKFTIGWNWAPDYGTSEDSKEMFEYLLGYSPLHNLRPGTAYPATMVTTADHDDRVVPAHSFKFAARLQECHNGKTPVIIRIDSKAGHGSGKPLAKVIEEQADIYGFIMHNLGMK